MEPPADELDRRRRWFRWYVERPGPAEPRTGPPGPLRCPCCGFLTLGERHAWEICPVCFWEDDGQDDPDADQVWGGPNGSLSLTQARENYRRLGACEERHVGHVRPPQEGELHGRGRVDPPK